MVPNRGWYFQLQQLTYIIIPSNYQLVTADSSCKMPKFAALY
jgi:hypothetical protein